VRKKHHPFIFSIFDKRGRPRASARLTAFARMAAPDPDVADLLAWATDKVLQNVWEPAFSREARRLRALASDGHT
jgi:hypothetical protein